MAGEAKLKFNSAKAKDFFKNAASGVKDVKSKHKDYITTIASIVLADIISHFEKEAGPKGPWKSWSSAYSAAMKKKGKGGNKILQDTGRLRNSFKPTNWRKDPKGILFFNDATTKSGFPYAAAHDTGDGQLPARPFMWLSDKAMGQVSNATLAFMTKRIG